MGKSQWKRHVLFSVTACIAEHHSLVTRTLLLRVGTYHTSIDICALLVDCREYTARVTVEHVVRLVVADTVNHITHDGLNVNVGVLCTYFTAHNYETCAAECLAGNLGFLVLSEEFIEDGI